MQHIDFNLGILIVAVLTSAANLFVYCYYGKIASDSYVKMADYMFESNWQPLSVDLQKYFILLIGNTQRPLYYHGFSVAVLNLETFCTVRKILDKSSLYLLNKLFLQLVRSVLSYYMMFKTLTSKQLSDGAMI